MEVHLTLAPMSPSGLTGLASSALLRTGFSVAVDDGHDTVVLHLRGELDMSTAAQFRGAVFTAMAANARAIVVDVAELSFIDSTGISAFMAGWRQATTEGRTLCLRHPTPLVVRVLRITGVDRILLEHPTTAGT